MPSTDLHILTLLNKVTPLLPLSFKKAKGWEEKKRTNLNVSMRNKLKHCSNLRKS